MNYLLAPLADFTDAPFRLLCRQGGADATYTEMVSAAALAHGHAPTRRLLELLPGEGPVACQIFGADAHDVAYATKYITDLGRFTEINLNAGCPMRTVTRAGAGSKLMEDPPKIARLLEAMVSNTTLPVTLKTRLGPHPGDTSIFEILSLAEKAGARGLLLHARYTSQCHGGPVHLDTLARVVEAASIPVVGNGSVVDAATAKAMAQTGVAGNGSVVDAATAKAMAQTGVAGILIGRAALPDPDIFARLKGLPVAPPDPATRARRHLELILAFHRQLVEHFPAEPLPRLDGYAAIKMHTHLFRYFNGRPGAAKLRARLNAVRTLDEIYSILKEFEQT